MTALDVPPSRPTPGDRLASFTLGTLAHGSFRVPNGRFVHLQFRRFAGCPVCSLHLRRFARVHEAFSSAGVDVVAFFHSSAASLAPYHADLPFPVVPDPERVYYSRFGVGRSMLGLVHPKVVWSGMKGLFAAPSSPFVGEGGHDGLPADLLIDPDGRLVASHYGAHADDQWEPDEVLARVRER
jgi:peroxiredoxin